jgi:hypothetical protein
MTLNGLELAGRAAVAGGSFGDIWMGYLGCHQISVKILKVYQRSDKTKLLKVNVLLEIYQIPVLKINLGVLQRSRDLATAQTPKCSPILWSISFGRRQTLSHFTMDA